MDHAGQLPLYEYRPIADGFIRLLYLLPAKNGREPIQATLNPHHLDDELTYEALSYTWGKPEPTTIISGDEGSLVIRQNLHDALYHLRDPHEMRRLWIDAVCIDQSNDAEKGKQVRMMSRIYYNATRVVVWLGLDDNPEVPAAEAFAVLEEASAAATKALRKHGGDIFALPEVSLADLATYDTKQWSLLADFFNTRPYFTRGWVIQELGLANEYIIICGDAQLSMRGFFPFVRWIMNKGQVLCDRFGFDVLGPYAATEFGFSTRIPKNLEHQTFLELLGISREIDFTDPRDHVYAFLSHPSALQQFYGDPSPFIHYQVTFSSSNWRPIIEPDYTKTTAQVYTNLASAIICQPKHPSPLVILSMVCHSDTSLLDMSCPSWVPQWDVPSLYAPFSNWNASASSKAYFSIKENRLLLLGTQIDTVIWAKSIEPDFCQAFYPALEETDSRFDRLTVLWNYYCYVAWRYKLGRPNREAFLLTLVGGHMGPMDIEKSEDRKSQFLKNVAAYQFETFMAMGRDVSEEKMTELRLRGEGGDAGRFLADLRSEAENRALFFTRSGRVGIGHYLVTEGDGLFLVKGAKVPFVLRRGYDKGCLRLVGEAYVHGIMRGDAFCEDDLDDIVLC